MHVIVETLDVYETDRQLLLNSCFYCNTWSDFPKLYSWHFISKDWTNKNWTKTKHLQTIKTKLKEKLKGKEKFENELKKTKYNNSVLSDYTVVVW